MADIHVISGNGKGDWRVVMHFDTPNVTNAVGTDVSSALVNSGLATSSILPVVDGNNGSISQTEQNELLAGTKIETVVTIKLDGKGSDNDSRRDLVRDIYAVTETQTINKLKARLKFFGLNLTKS